MVAVQATHVHYRPGGAVFNAECDCANPEGWPPTDEPAVLRSVDVASAASEPRKVPQPIRRRRVRARAQVVRARQFGARGARRVLAATRSTAVGVLHLIAALITALGNGAQIGGIAVATWAAWGIHPTAGKVVLAAGLLFLGGAISRVAKEVRNGTR